MALQSGTKLGPYEIRVLIGAGGMGEVYASVSGYHTGSYHSYAVSPDGEQFLIPRPVAVAAGTLPTPITVVLNWTAKLTRK